MRAELPAVALGLALGFGVLKTHLRAEPLGKSNRIAEFSTEKNHTKDELSASLR